MNNAMTLIITYINKFGIIHASDSNLTSNGANAGVGQKTFDIPFLKAGLTFAGDYCIDGKSADIWINNFIKQQESRSNLSLKEFVETITDNIQRSKREGEISGGNIIHIAGYVEIEGKSFPAFYVISNVNFDKDTGGYTKAREDFGFSEDFLRRDNPKNNLLARFQNETTLSQIYINGFPSGRISYLILQKKINQFFETIWNEKQWMFRPPKDIEESKKLVKLYMNIISVIFEISEYSARYIGGEPQICSIEQPSNIAIT